MAGYWGNAVYKRLPQDRETRMAEVGVFRGESSGWLLARLPLLTLYMIDQWRKYEESPQPDASDDAMAWDRHRRMAIARTDFAGSRRIIIHADSLQGAKAIANESLDMAFIDANHTYDYVLADMFAYWEKVKPGGYLAGHDWEKREPRKYGVVRAVTEFATAVNLPYELDEDATWFIKKPK